MLDSYHTSRISREHIADFKVGWNKVENDTGNVSRSSHRTPKAMIRPRSYPKPSTLVSNISKNSIKHPNMRSQNLSLG